MHACMHACTYTPKATENWNSGTKKYNKASKIHFTEILLYDNVTFRDIWGYIENREAILENKKKQ